MGQQPLHSEHVITGDPGSMLGAHAEVGMTVHSLNMAVQSLKHMQGSDRYQVYLDSDRLDIELAYRELGRVLGYRSVPVMQAAG